ncbi:retinol dehydrogenase 12 [Microdochium nivale]|nr:retinol dehydrogenase 12 [Microdochium nivale]
MGASGSKSVAFNPKTDIPSLKDKVILVTGGSSGLGTQSVLEFARHEPKEIWLGARNATKAQAAIDDIKAQVPNATIKFVEMELSSFASIRTAAKTVLESTDRLDILLLNAGIMAGPPGVTEDGYEIQFGTNHMGHALLTKLLKPLLLKTAEQHGGARVVVLSSAGHKYTPSGGIDFSTLKTPGNTLNAWQRYGQSKLSNVLFAKELARRHPQITTASLHPGVIKTNLSSTAKSDSWLMSVLVPLTSSFITNVEVGAWGQLWASISKDVVSGTYYVPVGVTGAGSSTTNNAELAKKLWDWTEKELEGKVAS